MSRYAEGTTVSVDSSRGELTGILTKHGVMRQAWGIAPEGDTLEFEYQDRRYRFLIRKPTVEEIFELFPNHRDTDAKMAQEWRRRWRAHVLLLKAKLEFVDGGDRTLEEELMANLVVAGGQTLGEWISTQQGSRLLLGAG